MATEPQVITLRDAKNASGGLVIDYAGTAPTDDDPFKCPATDAGLPLLRRWRVEMRCDPTVPGLELDPSNDRDVVVESPQCFYTGYTKSSAACGMPVTPSSIAEAVTSFVAL